MRHDLKQEALRLYPDLSEDEAARTVERFEAYVRLVLCMHERISTERLQPVRTVLQDGPLTENSNRSSLPKGADAEVRIVQ